MNTNKATISIAIERRALLDRVNRRLKEHGEQMFRTRGARAAKEIGHWYTVDLQKAVVSAAGLDLEKEARQLGVMQPWEKLA